MLHVLLTAIEATDPLAPGTALLRAGQLAGVAATVVVAARLLRAAGVARLVAISRRTTAAAALLSVLGTLGLANGAGTATAAAQESSCLETAQARCGIEQRVALLLAEGGKDAVLAELPKLTSDHLRGAYVSELLRQATLNEAALQRVLAVASSEIRSDDELAMLLLDDPPPSLDNAGAPGRSFLLRLCSTRILRPGTCTSTP